MMSNKKFYNDEKLKVNQKLRKRTTMKRNSNHFSKLLIENDMKMMVKKETVEVQGIKRFELERTSTPHSERMCEHCDHHHSLECCMYVYDNHDDIKRYSAFKHSVEEPYITDESDEDFNMKIGSATPNNFPLFTENDPNVADMKALGIFQFPQVVYLRQYFWPIFLPQSVTFQPLPPPVYYVQNPTNIKYCQPIVMGNQIAQYNAPCVMRQVAIPMQYGQNNNYNFKPYYQPQVIEAHNYLPINNYNNYYNQ